MENCNRVYDRAMCWGYIGIMENKMETATR